MPYSLKQCDGEFIVFWRAVRGQQGNRHTMVSGVSGDLWTFRRHLSTNLHKQLTSIQIEDYVDGTFAVQGDCHDALLIWLHKLRADGAI